ncbi:hypothetical protein DHW03_18975 [Pedobacter yonginense]|uniref:Helicase/UvrB N-terminal domain-containing protein n=1 Tax=Pedobacter yonginense TaxID=651869 RepID=A0A317EIF9_9SPHI|nr:DEAD/DEAH box helicase family protein [Pedobacter yonginense]PWS25917.1 hypothetical protein DHW03_18975 [Pedobacter yonginense]
MKQVAYQEEYINELTDTAIKLLNDKYREEGTIILKAPTGSGKTFMISQTLTKIVKKNSATSYSFIWLSVNSLHEQSRQSLSQYFEDEKLLDCILLNDIQNNTIEENEIVFLNWDSLIKQNNIFRMENEQDWNLASVIANTKDEGREVILIIDESHRTAKAEKALEVIEELKPRLTIEITATPTRISGHLIEIPLGRVVAEGMIKSEVQINPGSKQIKENKDLLSVALKKRKQLRQSYIDLGSDINPLLLIQIPNKKQTDSSNPEDYIIGLLADFDITEGNGKLAIRISGVDIKDLDEKVKPNNSQIDVLIFKEAIALGWDCPRAALLFLQREWKQDRYSFNIQTLGRIMRMPEQMHYPTKPELNIGYVFSASDNFEIVQELANDYVSNLQMERDEDLNIKPLKLASEFIRRKRELTRLSGDFKRCLFDAANFLNNEDPINEKVNQITKMVAIEGKVKNIDRDDKQEVVFDQKTSVKKDIKEITDSYVNFCASMVFPYAKVESTNTLKSSIRSWFKDKFEIGDEDIISTIVMSKVNNSKFRTIIQDAIEVYKKLPSKKDEIIVNDSWEIPESISVFTDYQLLPESKKSIIKQQDEKRLFVKKNKNGKLDLSNPEIEFIKNLDATDDDVLWWFKNGVSESKYFGIAYKKKDDFSYGFYPDFLIKTKKETLIIEIKDDKDFVPVNALKLSAGSDYVKRATGKEAVRFFMLSPIDYTRFFSSLKNQDLDKFKSSFEEKLLRYNKSNKTLIESKEEQSEKDKEVLELLSDLDQTINELKDQKFKNELLEMQLGEARENVDTLVKSLVTIKPNDTEPDPLKIEKPFNICVLGEASDHALISKELNKYFVKLGVSPTDWDIEYFNNSKLQNVNVLRSLHKGQSRFTIIITGQIFHHSGKGNAKANIISELKNEKYITHYIGANPKDLLTPDKIIDVVNEHIFTNN